MDGVLGIAVLFKDGSLFSASGTLIDNIPLCTSFFKISSVDAIGSRIIENSDIHVFVPSVINI